MTNSDKCGLIQQAFLEQLVIHKPENVSQWADRVRILSPEASSERGHWHCRPFQSEMMDVLTPESPYEQVVLMMASQIGKTETVLNFLGYIIDRDPGPCLVVEPRELDAKTFSKDRLNPMIRDTPELKAKVWRHGKGVLQAGESKMIGNSTTLHRKFYGGHVTMTGSIAPAGLAMRPVRYLLLDEVDRYPVSAGGEGDPVLLAIRRTDEFIWNKKILMCSTPTIEGMSRIARAYEDSDQRRPEVPCPLCGEFQGLDFFRLHCEREDDPETAEYECSACGKMIRTSARAGCWQKAAGASVIRPRALQASGSRRCTRAGAPGRN